MTEIPRYRLRWSRALLLALPGWLLAVVGINLSNVLVFGDPWMVMPVLRTVLVFTPVAFITAYFVRRQSYLNVTPDGLQTVVRGALVNFRWADFTGVATVAGCECLVFTRGVVAGHSATTRRLERRGLDLRILLGHYLADWRTSPLADLVAQHTPTSA